MNSYYLELHQLFNSLKRFDFPFEKNLNEIPNNGIYIIFEKGETYKNMDRIVRVGSHTGNNQLKNRLNEHFVKENKDRSIFRKNIGRCFLNRENNDYLSIWDIDSTSKKNREKYNLIKNINFEKQIEKQISDYIQNNLSFAIIEIINKNERLFWEKKIISSLAQFDKINISNNWLGKDSPKIKIVKYGLWQVNNLFDKQITENEYYSFVNLIKE